MTTRRQFITGTVALAGATALSAKSYARIMGANDRLNMAVMGLNSRGNGVMKGFLKHGSNIHSLCDVDTTVLERISGEVRNAGHNNVKTETDYRRVLDDRDVDAVVIATPDHWHAPAAIMGLQAGKHIYVEKPCSHNPREGELLVLAQEKYGKVVQMGNQQRSSAETTELVDMIRAGAIGDAYEAYTWYSNNRGSIGNGKHIPVPGNLDWDLWQGPAPRRKYHDNYVHYNWHWFWHWGTAETCNNAAHELDVARWALGLDFPSQVDANAARRFHVTDDWEMYDTMNVRFGYEDGRSITWEGHSCNTVNRFGRGRGTLIYGTKGSAIVDRAGYEIYDLAGKRISEKKLAKAATSTKDLVGGGALTDRHVKNFMDTVRGTAVQQNSPIDEGHKSTLMCLLANIAYRLDRRLECDPTNGRPTGQDVDALWGREYEPGWEPVL